MKIITPLLLPFLQLLRFLVKRTGAKTTPVIIDFFYASKEVIVKLSSINLQDFSWLCAIKRPNSMHPGHYLVTVNPWWSRLLDSWSSSPWLLKSYIVQKLNVLKLTLVLWSDLAARSLKFQNLPLLCCIIAFSWWPSSLKAEKNHSQYERLLVYLLW